MPLINYIGNRQEALGTRVGGFVRGAAPAPPSLILDYLVVGGGTSGRGGDGTYGIGGSGGGVISGSAVTMSFNSSIAIIVGAGGVSGSTAASSSMSGSSFAF